MKNVLLMLFLMGTIAIAQEKKVVVKVEGGEGKSKDAKVHEYTIHEGDDDDDAPMPMAHGMMMRGEDDDDMPMMDHEMMMKHLKLTDDQKKQIGKLHDDMEKKQIELRSKIQSLRVDLRGLFRDDKPEQGKIESKVSEIGKLQTEMKLTHLGCWFSVGKLLTDDQKKMWKKHGMMMGMERMRGRAPMPMMKHKMRIMKGHEEKEDDD